MKKLAFLISSLLITSAAFCQVQGDLSASPIVSYFHDYDNCGTIGNMGFTVTVSNSSLNDTLRVIDPSNGSPLFTAVNNNGENPWFVTTSQMLTAYSPDQMVNNGLVPLFFQPVKIICRPDTLFPNTMVMENVSNPCTYGDVSGKVYIDSNNDCIFNTGDTPLSSISVWAQENVTNTQGNSTLTYSGYSDGSGNYTINLQETWMTNYMITLLGSYQFIFPNAPCSPIPYTFNSLPQTGVDIPLLCADIDVSAYAYHSGAVRPGVPFMLFPRVQNEGCDPASGVLKLVLDSRVTYNPALSTNLPTSVSGDTLFWNYNGLSNLSNGAYWNSFISNLHITPNVSVNIGDTLCFYISASVPGTDINPANNVSSLCVPVVNSYDPNIKEASPKGVGAPGYIPSATHELVYTIHFQNTGNAPALDVTVRDSLKQHINPNSLRILASSHTMTPVWEAPGVVAFHFYGINLADSASNEPASHGFVSFKVSLDNNLQSGDQIKNTAHIYFDFNPAIVTNTALNTIHQGMGIEETGNESLSVYPNPSDGIYTVRLSEKSAQENVSLTVYTIAGQPVYRKKATSDLIQIDLSQLPAGLYILSVEGEKPLKQRLIKR